MTTIVEGRLSKGVISISLLDALEKQMNPTMDVNTNVAMSYYTLQMQFDKALGHLEVFLLICLRTC